MRLPRATLWLILSIAAVLPAQADEPARPGNAAIHYWCAAAVMKRPANDQEDKILDYIEGWRHLPPKVFIERGEVVSFLKEDLEAGGAIDLLHIGAECPQCDFETGRLTGDVWSVPSLSVFRELARRGWAANVALEGQGNVLRAAQLHADLLQFSAHLSQCPTWIYAIYGETLLGQCLDRMGAFLARKPGAESLRALMDRLNRIPPNPLSFSRCYSYEAKCLPVQLKKERRLTDEALDEALRTAGNDDFKMSFGLKWKTIVQLLRSRKPEERQGVLNGWATQFGDKLSAVAKAGDAPPAESEPRVREWVERMKRLDGRIDGNGTLGNPFLAMFSAPVMRTYAVFALENARLEMGRILCAAALCEAENGRYPASLEDLARYFPSGLPKDPFTGKDFLYALEEGLPSVTAQPAKSLLQELDAWDCRMSMARTLKMQAECLERYQKEVRSPAQDAHN